MVEEFQELLLETSSYLRRRLRVREQMVQTKFEIRNTIEVVRVSQTEQPTSPLKKRIESMIQWEVRETGGGQDFIGNVKTDFYRPHQAVQCT